MSGKSDITEDVEVYKMKEVSGYNVKTRQKTNIKNPQLITMKNGRKAIKGIATEDGKTTLYRMISDAEAKDFESKK
jgi:hypothetical protein